MAANYYCPAVVYGGATFWLPPNVEAEFTRNQTVESVNPPQTNQLKILSVRPNQGTRISLTVGGKKPGQLTQAAVLSWFEEMWAAMSGEDKVFDFFLFSDRCWKNCALETQVDKIGLERLLVLNGGSLSFICENTAPTTSTQLTFTDYNSEYPYASLVGRPLGNAAEPGEVANVAQPVVQNLPGTFYGGQEVITAAGQEIRFTVQGTVGSQWRLFSLQVLLADPVAATGTTTVKASTLGAGSAGPFLSASVTAGQYHGMEGTGSILVTAGDTIFLFVSAAGGHQNVQVQASLKAVTN